MTIFHLFFGFSGRINRGKYWLTLVLWLVIWIIAVAAFLLGGLAIFDLDLKDGSLPSPEDVAAFWRMVRDYVALSLIVLAFVIATWVCCGGCRREIRPEVMDRSDGGAVRARQ